MRFALTLDRLHASIRQNKWLWYFAVFCRVGLALGFIPSGLVKIFGERFTSLSGNHPMGHYLDALFVTGYYYTFIGIMQVTAAVLLLIPRTATLGAVIYFPIIFNICILSLSVRFDGSLISSPLMVLANLYLFCWDYHKFKWILPFKHPGAPVMPKRKELSNKFPAIFFAGVVATIVVVIVTLTCMYDLKPRNTISDCRAQCPNSQNPEACMEFCDCIHRQGQPLGKCLEIYEKALNIRE